jgi:hypothetical protein
VFPAKSGGAIQFRSAPAPTAVFAPATVLEKSAKPPTAVLSSAVLRAAPLGTALA